MICAIWKLHGAISISHMHNLQIPDLNLAQKGQHPKPKPDPNHNLTYT